MRYKYIVHDCHLCLPFTQALINKTMEPYIKKALRRFNDGYPVWEVIFNLKKQCGDLYEGYVKLIKIVHSKNIETFDHYAVHSEDFHIAYQHYGSEGFWATLKQLIRNCIYIDNRREFCLSYIEAEALYEHLKYPRS